MVAELVELSSVIAEIYDAAVEPALWPQALASICAYVGGSSAVLFWHDAATQYSQALHLFNDDPQYTKLYFEKYVQMNPVFPAATFMEVGLVHSANDIVPQEELEQTRFYKEWIEPQGIVDLVAVNLEKGVTRSAFLNVRTDESYGRMDETMRQRMSALVPHLQRAVAIGRLFERERSENQALHVTLDHIDAGVFLVDAKGAITFANEPAKAALHETALIQIVDNVLRPAEPATDTVLHDAFAAAAKGDASIGVRGVAVPLGAAGQDRWFAHVLPLTDGRRQAAGEASGAVAAVFIRKIAPNAPPALESIAKLYRLTATETQVLNALSSVRGIKRMADALGLSENTVKFHLRNMFRKTGTTRQADLMKLVTGV